MSTESTSLQALGETACLVCYVCDPHVVVTGCYIQGEFVRAENFAEKLLVRWTADITEECGVWPQKEAA